MININSYKQEEFEGNKANNKYYIPRAVSKIYTFSSVTYFPGATRWLGDPADVYVCMLTHSTMQVVVTTTCSNWWWWCSSDDAGVVEDTKKYIRVTRLRHWTEWNWLEASLLTTKATWYKPCAFSSRCYRVLRVAAARATTALSVPQPNLFPLLRVPLYSLPSLRIHAAATFVQAAARGCRYQRRPIVSQRWRIFSNVYLQKTVIILHRCPRFYFIVIGMINIVLASDNL